MKITACVMAIGLAFAVLTTLGAPEKPKFNPDEALGFLETLGTIKMHDDRRENIIYYYSPDAKLLATLFNARFAPGAGNSFVKAVETFVSAGLLTAGRSDLYLKHVKPQSKFMDVEELERKVTKRCAAGCHDGMIDKACGRCGGRGRCPECGGEGRIKTNMTTMYDSRFPKDTYWITKMCGTCRGKGHCPKCNGLGKIVEECPDCKGKGRIFDQESAARIYANTAIMMIKYLCDVGDASEMPDILKRDFKKAREKAEEKFEVIREMREDEEAEARAEQERKEQAERERKEREEKEERERREREEKEERERKEREEREAFEAEQRAKGLVKYGDRWLTPEQKEQVQREDVATVKRIVNEVLETNKRGDVDYRHWDDVRLASKLYAPRSWEIVDANAWGNTATVTARVDSSNKGGAQITVLWMYYLSRKSGSWKVTNLIEKQ